MSWTWPSTTGKHSVVRGCQGVSVWLLKYTFCLQIPQNMKKDCVGAFRSLALNSATYGYKSFRNALKTNEENAVKKPASEKARYNWFKKGCCF